METTNPYLYSVETMDDDYMDWTQHPFISPLAIGYLPDSSQQLSSFLSLDNTMSIANNNDILQYIHHPSDPPAQYYQQQHQHKPMDDDDDDDDDDEDDDDDYSLDCSTSTTQQTYIPTNFPLDFLNDYIFNITRSYVSLSDVNAFVAKADSVKHSTSNHSHWENESSPSCSVSSSSSFFMEPSTMLFNQDDHCLVEIITSPVSCNSLDHKENPIYHSEEDDDYRFPSIRHTRKPQTIKRKSFSVKKGRNVDKACNHCKHSHLRCDEMRPCRRCVSTGKSDCQDVQHKPRGRPKLYKTSK